MTYTYDSADRLATVTDWSARVTRLRYDATTSRLARIELPNGTQRVFSYDSAGRVAAVRDEVVANGVLVSGFNLGYDAHNRLSGGDNSSYTCAALLRGARLTLIESCIRLSSCSCLRRL